MQSEIYQEYVDSDYRITGTSGNFSYRIPLTGKFNRVAVVSANIPKTFNLIQAGANTFTLTEVSGDRTITIPVGDYSQSRFQTDLLALLNTGTYVYSISNNTLINKSTYLVSGNGIFQPTFTFPLGSALYRMMGFEYGTTNTFSANSLVAPNIGFFQFTNVVFIRSNIHRSPSSSLSGDILQQIVCIANPQLSAITYAAVDLEKQAKVFSGTGDVFNFWITDSDGFVLDLNGIPINFELAFWNYDDTNKILKAKAFLDNIAGMKADYQDKPSDRLR